MEARCGGPAQRLTSILLRQRMPTRGDEASLRVDAAGNPRLPHSQKTWMAGTKPGRLARKIRFALLPGHDGNIRPSDISGSCEPAHIRASPPELSRCGAHQRVQHENEFRVCDG